ncbi:MAG: hypothetical protein JJE04_13610 [Acidobacteriia bacterium]|nr:hypothetical protein [Terriglobia bacterium]
MNRKPHPLLIALALFVLNVALNAALFLPGEGKYRDSIEAGYASMAHFLSQYPDPFGWNPFQYCGLPTHMWYLPGLPYLGALVIHLLPMLKPEHAYRITATGLACLGPSTVFLLAFYFTRSRRWAFFAAILYTFNSPSYALFKQIDADRGFSFLPWRVQVLTKYGEGPHNAGLMLIPLALIACWRAAVGRGYPLILLAAILLAAVTLTNWIAAMALAWCCLMMLLAGMRSAPRTGFLAHRMLAAAGLAYLLACLWLSPRFIQTTMLNWPMDAFNYKMQGQQYALFAGLVFIALALWLWFRRSQGHDYLFWLLLCFSGFTWIVANHYWFKLDTIPESRRYAVEMELFLFLILAELLRIAFADGRQRWREIGIALMAWIFAWASLQAATYSVRTWIMLRPVPRQTTIEYQVADFLHSQHSQGRVMVTGGTRFRLNSWFLIPQTGGTFESGLRNRNPLHFSYQLRTGLGQKPETRGEESIGLLRLLGAEYIAVHGQGSREHWHDIQQPRMFDGLLPRIHGDDKDAIYKVPFHGLAHLVFERELPIRVPVGYDAHLAGPYLAAMDDTSRPKLSLRWEGASKIHVSGPIPDGMLVSLQVSYDGGWRAWQDEEPLAMEGDEMGYILLRPKASASSNIRLQYIGTKEHRAFALLGASAWTVALGALWLTRRRLPWTR